MSGFSASLRLLAESWVSCRCESCHLSSSLHQGFKKTKQRNHFSMISPTTARPWPSGYRTAWACRHTSWEETEPQHQTVTHQEEKNTFTDSNSETEKKDSMNVQNLKPLSASARDDDMFSMCCFKFTAKIKIYSSVCVFFYVRILFYVIIRATVTWQGQKNVSSQGI